jgi:hypothetical protein
MVGASSWPMRTAWTWGEKLAKSRIGAGAAASGASGWPLADPVLAKAAVVTLAAKTASHGPNWRILSPNQAQQRRLILYATGLSERLPPGEQSPLQM